jgi:ABC-type lipoprotein export system ATPase subunit
VADEPTGNLDTQTARDVFELLQAQAAAGKTVIVVTHDRDWAAQAHRTITLVDGRIGDAAVVKKVA